MRELRLETGSRAAATQAFRAQTADQPVRSQGRTRFQPVAVAQPDVADDIAFLQFHGVPFGPLWRASRLAAKTGLTARQCLIANGQFAEERYLAALCHRTGLAIAKTIAPVRRTQAADAIRQGWFQGVTADGRPLLVINILGPALPAVLDARQQRPFVTLATDAAFNRMVRDGLADDIARAASASVPLAESARTGLTRHQRLALVAIALALMTVSLIDMTFALVFVPIALGLVFFAATIVQLASGIESRQAQDVPPPVDDAALPRYSILVPLHREDPVLDQLIDALLRLDYPVEKLQILLVTEETDAMTRDALARRALPFHIREFVAPDGLPRTKPRALNAAMPFVTGDIVVVYDAEDRPDPDQMRRAAPAFRAAPTATACLQARLVIDNVDDGPLTKLFAIEYAALFDMTKSGCARLGLPVPLGGTSNHFRVTALRQVGLWDAWNVTEDADLGYRLAQHGFHVGDLPSDTLEEAPARLKAWLAQRTRWLKGWMQTVISHSRTPIRSIRTMGFGNFVAAVSQSFGVLVGALFGPLFQLLAIWRISSDNFLAGIDMIDALADGFMITLIVFGGFAMYGPAILAVRARRLHGVWLWVILLPLYSVLISLAGWRALIELARAPHQWNKTTHGLARTSRSKVLRR